MDTINIFMLIHAFLASITIPPYLILIRNYISEGKDIKDGQRTLFFFLNILAFGGLFIAILNVGIAVTYLFGVDFTKYRDETITVFAIRALLIDVGLLISSWGFTFIARGRQ